MGSNACKGTVTYTTSNNRHVPERGATVSGRLQHGGSSDLWQHSGRSLSRLTVGGHSTAQDQKRVQVHSVAGKYRVQGITLLRLAACTHVSVISVGYIHVRRSRVCMHVCRRSRAHHNNTTRTRTRASVITVGYVHLFDGHNNTREHTRVPLLISAPVSMTASMTAWLTIGCLGELRPGYESYYDAASPTRRLHARTLARKC